jgi:hypothetical protein
VKSWPGEFRITVQGGIAPEWQDCLGGLSVRVVTDEDGSLVSILHGRLADQAALGGVLRTLGDLRVPLISVDRLDDATS